MVRSLRLPILLLAPALVLGAWIDVPLAKPSLLSERAIAFRTDSIPARPHSFAVICTDLNGDGALDLALTHPRLGSASACFGNDDGTFAPCLDLGRVGANPRGLAAADFNRDGIPDLALAATGDGAVVVLDGLGGGRFRPPRKVATAGNPFLVTAADFDREGVPDLAVAQESSGVVILLADGQGGFKQSSYATGKWSSDVAAADFNGDGTLDMAVTNWGSNDVSLLFGRGDGTFFPARNITYEGEFWEHHSLYRVLAADLDRDGHVDMVWNDIIKHSLYLVYGDGTGEFPRHASVPAGQGVRYADAADLDGDGWLDLVSANTADDDVTVLLSDGQGGYIPPQRVPVGRFPRMVAACDMNRDGRPDLAVTNLKAENVKVLINDGVTDAAAVAPPPRRKPLGPVLHQPSAILVSPDGQLVVADEGNHRVVKVDPRAGALETIAGTGYKGSGGDKGPALDAQLNLPTGLAMDQAGNLYVADSGNNRIRRIDARGVIDTIAGTGSAGYSGDGGPAELAQLDRPTALVVDQSGALFIAEAASNRIRKVDSSGTITTVGVESNAAGDTEPGLRAPSGLAIDATGALLIADLLNLRVRRLQPGGALTTVAGNGTLGSGGDGGPAIHAQLGYPTAICSGPDGSIYIADPVNSMIRVVTPSGAIRTLAAAPKGTAGWEPAGVAADRMGNVYFTDRRQGSVRRIDSSGVVSTVLGPELAAVRFHEVHTKPDSIDLLPPDKLHRPADLVWEYKLRSGSDDNSAYAVAPAPDGHIYVAGDVGSGADWRVQQLDPGGKPGWRFDLATDDIDVPLALTLTPDGQVVSAGMLFGGDQTGRDAAVIALGRNGQERWRFVESEPGDQVCRGVAADAAGNLYLACESTQRWDIFSLDDRGTLRWRYRDGTQGSARAIAVNARGEVFVGGDEQETWRVVKLNPDRSIAWQHRASGRGTVNGIGATADGGAVAVGSRTRDRLNLRAERLSATGDVVWEYEASSPAGAVIARAVTLDTNGLPIIAGEIGSDWLVLALGAEGRRRWHFTHDGGGGLKNRDQAFAVAFVPPDTILVAGRIHPLPPTPPSLGPVEWRVAAYRAPRSP